MPLTPYWAQAWRHGRPRALPHSRVQADLLEGHQLPRALVASLVHHAIGALPNLLHLLERGLDGLHGAASAWRWHWAQLALCSEGRGKSRKQKGECGESV